MIIISLIMEANANNRQIFSTYGPYMLKPDVLPISYNLSLLYDIDPMSNFSFYGEVIIEMLAMNDVSYITLQAQGYYINYSEISLLNDGTPHHIIDAKIDENYQRLILILKKKLVTQKKYTLTIPFFGDIKMSNERGVVIGQFTNEDEFTREYFIATRLKPSFARRVFPCIDEPGYKSKFTLILGHEKQYESISNMPLEYTSSSNLLSFWPWDKVAITLRKEEFNFKWNVFQVTPPISTYLLSFVISKFKSKVSQSPSHVKFRIWARPDVIHQGDHALSIGSEYIPHYEKLFNWTMPAKKLDLVAIPNFKYGIIENLGIISFPESDILDEEKYSSVLGNVEQTYTIANAISHQWFGNVLTFFWWSEYWFTESIAAFTTRRALTKMKPAWKTSIELEEGSSIIYVLEKEYTDAARPLTTVIKDPTEYPKHFDESSIIKGTFLVRMLHKIYGDVTFRDAMRNHLQTYEFFGASVELFWDTLSNTSRITLPINVSAANVMSTWTAHTGYPLLTVERNYASKMLSVYQARYTGNKECSTFLPPTWWIPLRITSQSDSYERPLKWLAVNEGLKKPKMYSHSSTSDQWVLFNTDLIAPYRVNYDSRNWKLVVDALRSSLYAQVPALARVQLLSDAFELAWSGKLDYSVPLQMATYLQQEEMYQPWNIGLRSLSRIGNILKRTAHYGIYKKYIRMLMAKIYNTVGGLGSDTMNDIKDLDSTKLQVLLSEWACRMDVPTCQKSAVQLFDKWMSSANPDKENPIPLDLRRTVYCTAVSRGSERHWLFVFERKKQAKFASAVKTLQYALSCTKELWILSKFMETSISSRTSPDALDTESVISEVLQSPSGYYVGKEIFYRNFTDIQKLEPNKLDKMLYVLLKQITTTKELNEFQIWREQYPWLFKNLTDVLDDGIEMAKDNIDWVNNNMDNVVKLLRENTLYVDEYQYYRVSFKEVITNKTITPRVNNVKLHSAEYKQILLLMLILLCTNKIKRF